MSIDRGNVRGLVRAIAYDVRGARLGRVAQVFLDDRSDEPAWVAVDVTRTRGMRLLPLAGAALKGRHLVIRAERTTVRSAPRIDLGDGQLSSQDEARLLEHYGLLPASGNEYSQTAEQRPASPWPDDNERETAWQPPGQPTPDPQDHSQGWDQRHTESDQPAHRQADAPAPQSDTVPSTPVEGPGPAPASPAPTPEAEPGQGSQARPEQGWGPPATPPDGQSSGTGPGR